MAPTIKKPSKKSSKSHASAPTLPAKKLFGAPIIKTSEASIPLFVFLFIQFLRQNPKQGLFRIPGSTLLIQKAKTDLESGHECLYLYQKEYTHVVASLLKMWFRDLPEPLLTFDHYDMFIAADGINEENARLHTIKKVLQYLPEANRKLLYSLCEFLHDLLEYAEETKMNAGNLAIVFAPNLLRPRVEDFGTLMSDTPHATGLMQTLIEEFEFLFQDYLTEESKERERLKQKALESMHADEDSSPVAEMHTRTTSEATTDFVGMGSSTTPPQKSKSSKKLPKILPSLPKKQKKDKTLQQDTSITTSTSTPLSAQTQTQSGFKLPGAFGEELKLKIQQSVEKRTSVGNSSSPITSPKNGRVFSGKSDDSSQRRTTPPETPMRTSSLAFMQEIRMAPFTTDETSSKLTAPPAVPPKSTRARTAVLAYNDTNNSTPSTPSTPTSGGKKPPALPPRPQGLSAPPPIPDRKGRSKSTTSGPPSHSDE